MLLLLFRVGEAIHAIDAAGVVEVMPLIEVTRANQAPHGLVGTINYRGGFLPVIDLSELLFSRHVAARMNTRTVIVRYRIGPLSRLAALVAEDVTETMLCSASDVVAPGVTTASRPFLGGFIKSPRGLVQLVDMDKLATFVVPDMQMLA